MEENARIGRGAAENNEAASWTERQNERREAAAEAPGRETVTSETVRRATAVLKRYQQGKAVLRDRIVRNERWFKLRQWEELKTAEKQVQPASAWLLNSIANKHADAMDNLPRPNILPREEGDKEEATRLSSVLPVAFEQAEFERVWSDLWWDKLKNGTGVYGVFWDSAKWNGLGDVNIVKIDLLNLYWEPGITDLQESENVFVCEAVSNDRIKETYPEAAESLGKTAEFAEYIHDESIDTKDKSIVIDWYYKRSAGGGKTVLHYVKFVGDHVLYATENDPENAERGLYDHGMYPFVIDVLYPVADEVAGFGYIDIGKSPQEYIDRLDQAFLQNALAGARPRYFVSDSSPVNLDELADTEKQIVQVPGMVTDTNIRPIDVQTIPGNYINLKEAKIDEIKENTGNRDVTTGGSAAGVTAASAIAAMQEAGSKLSRDHIKSAYRAFRDVCRITIEIMRQFYNAPRYFRITGETGETEFVSYDNRGLQDRVYGTEYGQDMGVHRSIFDIEITAEKASPYARLSQNELAIQLYQLGIYDPANADRAMMLLDMMDFEGKAALQSKVAQFGGIYEQLQQMQQVMVGMQERLDRYEGTQNAPLFAAQLGNAGTMPAPQGGKPAADPAAESSVTANARRRVAESTTPR